MRHQRCDGAAQLQVGFNMPQRVVLVLMQPSVLSELCSVLCMVCLQGPVNCLILRGRRPCAQNTPGLAGDMQCKCDCACPACVNLEVSGWQGLLPLCAPWASMIVAKRKTSPITGWAPGARGAVQPDCTGNNASHCSWMGCCCVCRCSLVLPAARVESKKH